MRDRIGILGGTFDPIHMGHLIAAEGVKTEIHLDRVIFLPAARSPHKDAAGISEAERRLDMVRMAVEDNPAFEVSDLEIRRGGTSYTIETIREMKTRLGESVDLFFLMGEDSLLEITTWKDYELLLEECTVVVFRRPGVDLGRMDDEILRRIRMVPTCEIDVASRDIRERVREGYSIRYLVPPAVEAYIHLENLYS
ncbi:MAG: nicotinate-nucleotide adenylyltransferase [Candidatus Eisenbacteria sp.]|nr:nicotinate-nucleotide adenylyltransferase [Candidatus Eisenbacteria bacterium]